MSFKTPSLFLIDKPANIHSGIQALQKLFENLPWLDVVYGLASTGISRSAAGYTELEPEVYTGKGKYQTVLPNNFINSHLFFKQDSPARPVEYLPFQANTYQADVSIICLFNLDKLKKSEGFAYKHRYTEELKNSLVRLLGSFSDYTIKAIYDAPEDVFRGYTYDHVARQTFKHPEAGFRIAGTLLFNQTCTPLRFIGDPVFGCTDPLALNYNPLATVNDGTCQYEPELQAPAIPVLSFPLSGAANQSLSLTVNWFSATYATSYQVQVDTDSGFASPDIDVNGITALNYTVSGLENSTTYFWRVRAHNSVGASAWSEVRSFGTAAAVVNLPTVPVLVAPANNAGDIPLSTTLSWNPSLYANSYHVQVATSAAFTTLVYDVNSITGLSTLVSGLGYATEYFWRVRGLNASGASAWSLVRSFNSLAEPFVLPAQVVLVSPTAAATGVSVNETFTWAAAADAETYQIQIDTVNTFTSPDRDISGITGLNYVATGLSYSTIYFWRVRAINSDGAGAWSLVRQFEAEAEPVAVPDAPILSTPAAGATGVELPPEFTCFHVANADFYHIQISTVNNFASLVYENTGLISDGTKAGIFVNDFLSTNTTYYWRMRARNTGGSGAWSLVRSFDTNVVPVVLPDVPVLNTPAAGATNTATALSLSWLTAANATSYHVQISTVSNFATTVANVSGITGLSYAASGLSNSTTYYWRVRAANSNGNSAWSAVRNFATMAATPVLPDQVVLNQPVNSAVNQAVSLTFSWYAAANADSYQIQVATDTAFTIPVVNVQDLAALSRNVTGLSNSTTYYWRVRGHNADGAGAWSLVRTFGTVALSTANLIFYETAEGSLFQETTDGSGHVVYTVHDHTTTPAGANLNRTHDVETFEVQKAGYLTGAFRPLQKVANPFPTSPINNSAYCARFEINSDQPLATNGSSLEKIRSEVTVVKGSEDTWFPSSGEVWYSFDILFPTDGMEPRGGMEYDTNRDAICQWFENGGNETTLRVEKGKFFLETLPASGSISPSTMVKYDLFGSGSGTDISSFTAMQKGVWTNFVFHIKHSTSGTGFIKIYRNATTGTELPIHTYTGRNMSGGVSGSPNWPKWKIGLYKSNLIDRRDEAGSISRVVYFDNIKVGNNNSTLAEMM